MVRHSVDGAMSFQSRAVRGGFRMKRLMFGRSVSAALLLGLRDTQAEACA